MLCTCQVKRGTKIVVAGVDVGAELEHLLKLVGVPNGGSGTHNDGQQRAFDALNFVG